MTTRAEPGTTGTIGVGEDAAYIAAEVADRIARAVKKELTT